MRYKLDASGYVCAVSFGCYLDDCTEYTGEVPLGYKSLDDWASHSCIQAYYIDLAGNLVLDYAKKIECENKQAQELIDYSPVLRKDLYETDELLNSQYLRKTATGKVIVLEDIKTIAPRVKITGIEPCAYNELRIYTQGKNMMRCDAVSTNISGVTFTKNISGSITILGTATKDIEYIISDGETAPIFALKENQDYFLNLGGMQCELRYFDGETTAQQYVGASGLLNLPKSIEVTQVVIKIAKGKTVNTTFYPQLECGPTFTSYDPFKCKPLLIDISEIWNEPLLPSDTLYADDTLYPGVIPKVIDYILIEDGKIIISANDGVHVFGNGSVGLFSSYSTIYATKDVTLEVEYSANLIDVNSLEFLQGKATTTNKFKILADGSIEAHNGYYSGKIEATSGYFKGKIESAEGEIGGFTIKKNSIYSNKTSLYDYNSGVYLGEDGISVGFGSITGTSTFAVTKDGDIYLGYDSEIHLKGALNFESSTYSYIAYNRVEKMSFDSSGIKVYDDILVQGSGECIKASYMSSDFYMKFETSKLSLGALYNVIGKNNGNVGFFGSTGASKKYVSTISSVSSTTASDCASKINELINALKGYNLIG